MERTQSQLCARLADRLCGDNAHGLALLHQAVGSEIAAVALGADTLLRLTGEHRADLNRLDRRLVDTVGGNVVDLLAGSHDDLTGLRIHDIVDRNAAENTLAERHHHFIVFLDLGAYEAAESAAVLLVDDHVVSHINQTTGQITGVGGLQSRVGQTLSGTVGGDEVLQHRQTLLEVGQNRVLDDLTALGTALLRLGHKATHA